MIQGKECTLVGPLVPLLWLWLCLFSEVSFWSSIEESFKSTVQHPAQLRRAKGNRACWWSTTFVRFVLMSPRYVTTGQYTTLSHFYQLDIRHRDVKADRLQHSWITWCSCWRIMWAGLAMFEYLLLGSWFFGRKIQTRERHVCMALSDALWLGVTLHAHPWRSCSVWSW